MGMSGEITVDIEAGEARRQLKNESGFTVFQTEEVYQWGPLPAAEAEPPGGDISDGESIGNQRRLLSRSRLLVAFPALSICLFVSFIDQTSVSTSIPAISAELGTGAATPWIGASFLIASTSFQLINGRLSDIFGRKSLLAACLALMGLGDLLAGFARTKEELFAFRAVAGVGGGGINSIVMIIVSDITTLESRGKYQGILGAIIALANGTGPFIGGAFVQGATWRWVFWIIPMLAAPAAVVIIFFLPLKHDRGNYVAKAKKIDFGGIALNLAAVLLVLIPLSGGGISYAWTSAEFIAMITVGGILCILFILYEWLLAPVPIMPMRLFQNARCCFLYAQSFFSGICFYGNFFYLPIYFQSVLGKSAVASGALIMPLIIASSFTSILSGQFMSRIGRYMPCITLGFALWTLGAGLTCTFAKSTPVYVMVLVLLVEGLGVGMTLQPVLVGTLANSRTEDRGVVTGLRNFIRTIGGGFGLIVSGAVLSNTLRARLSGLPFISWETIQGVSSSAYSLDSLGLTPAQRDQVLAIYMSGLHYIFVFYACAASANLVLSVGIGNTSLKARGASEPPRPIKGRGEPTEDGGVCQRASSAELNGGETDNNSTRQEEKA